MYKALKSYPFFFIFLALIFIFQMYYRYFYPFEHHTHLDSKTFFIEGKIVRIFDLKEFQQFGKLKYFHKFFFETEHKRYQIQYTGLYPEPLLLKLGSSLKLKVSFIKERELRDYGQQSEKIYWIANQLNGKLKLHHFQAITKPKKLFDFVKALRYRFLNQLKYAVEQDFSKVERSLIFAMVLGEKEELDPRLYERFRTLGLSHILVASGSNLLLVLILFSKTFKNFGHYRKKMITLICFLGLYTYLSGGDPSIERAFYFSLSGFLFKNKYFSIAPLQKASFMCSLALILHPYYVFSLGFLLSSSLALFLSYQNYTLYPLPTLFFTKKSKKLKGEKLYQSLKTYILCQLLTLPFLASLSSYFSIWALCLNILLIPILEIFLLFSFPYLFFKSFSFPIFQAFSHALSFILKVFFYGFYFLFNLDNKPYLDFFKNFPMIYYKQCLFLFPFFIYFISVRTFKYFHFKRKKCLILACMFSCVILSLNLYQHYSSMNKFSVYFFDVGQGDSTFLNYNHHYFLIDAGLPQMSKRIQKNLDFLSVYKVDLGIATHEDLDHIGGFEELAQQGRIRSFVLGDREGKYHKNRKASQKNPRVWMESKDYIRIWDEKESERKQLMYDFKEKYGLILRTPDAFDLKHENSNSLIFHLKHPNIQFLFLADIGKEEEEAYFLDELGRCTLDLKIPIVLKIAHHGSKHSSSSKFIKACKPILAILSSGKQNVYGHPHQSVLKLLEEEGIPYSRTDIQGHFEIHRWFNQIYYRVFKGHFYGEEKLPWKRLP